MSGYAGLARKTS